MNLRTVQFWPRHTKRECTVRYLGSEVEDAREIPEQTELWHPTLARALKAAVSFVAVVQSIALDNRNRGVADDQLEKKIFLAERPQWRMRFSEWPLLVVTRRPLSR